MRNISFIPRLVVGCVLLMALSASVCMGQFFGYGYKQWEKLQNDAKWNFAPWYITVPPKSVAAVEVPRTTYAEMLGRGYARIGEVSYRSEKHGSAEAAGKKDMLEWGMFQGADVAWVSTSNDSYKGDVLIRGGTYSNYHVGSDPYMHNGDVSSTTTYTTKDHYHTKTIKFVEGDVVYFVHDPELAAKQLEQGRKNWETRLAQIPLKRAAMVAKLEVVLNTLSSTDASLFLEPGLKEQYVRSMQAAENEVKTGQCGYNGPWQETWQDTSARISRDGNLCQGLKDLDSLSWIFFWSDAGDKSRYEHTFKDSKSPQLGKLYSVVTDTWRYLKDNWDLIGDNLTPTLREHILLCGNEKLFASVPCWDKQ
ncbi:MAG: hypothetical protein WCA89_01005 [Terracidiphilus sp.]